MEILVFIFREKETDACNYRNEILKCSCRLPTCTRDISGALGDSKRDLKSNREIPEFRLKPTPSLARVSFGLDSHFHTKFSETFIFFSSHAHKWLAQLPRVIGTAECKTLKPRVQFTFHPAPQNAKWGRRKGYSRGKVCSEGASHVVTRTSWGTTRGLVACMYEGEGMEEGMPARRHSGPLGI